MTAPNLSKIDVIAPNFKKRHSGVTSTVIRLVPLQAKEIAICAVAPDLPAEVPNTHWSRLLTMSRRGPSGARVWHARRNVEMVAGLALKHLGRKRLALLFTSAAQRRHTGFTRWLIARMDHIIATSARSASYLDREATVIRHGVDCDLFHPVDDRAALRRRLDLPDDGLLVGCFGRIRPQKGNDLFVQAMIATCKAVPQARGLVMGRATGEHSEFLAGLKAQVGDAGLSDRILFRDEVPIADVPAHFQAVDLYVAPQRWEGFGLTPLEAMASGAPVVATRVGAFEELVVPDETGTLIGIEEVDRMTAD
ncbi:MAG: glycosyltransferase family 4 protein, partial [Pseudomonadota bacterium]